MRNLKLSKPIWVIVGALLLTLCGICVVNIIVYAHKEGLYTNLWSGACECNADEVRQALKEGADPNFKQGSASEAGTPLHRAQACTDRNVFILLKQAGAKE